MAEENGWVVFAQVASPIVALALGVVGVWNEKIKNRLFGPRLELEVHEPGGHFTHTNKGEIRRYYLVKVKNTSGKNTARNVRLRLITLQSIFKDGSRSDQSPSMPLLLLLSSGGDKTAIDINTYDCYNIGFMAEYNEGCFTIQDEQGLFSFHSQIEAFETVKIGLEIQADNLTHSKTQYLMLTWQDNERSSDSPWSSIPVLSLAD